jgi:hypothetical protein
MDCFEKSASWLKVDVGSEDIIDDFEFLYDGVNANIGHIQLLLNLGWLSRRQRGTLPLQDLLGRAWLLVALRIFRLSINERVSSCESIVTDDTKRNDKSPPSQEHMEPTWQR